jgi:hypothetical protein
MPKGIYERKPQSEEWKRNSREGMLKYWRENPDARDIVSRQVKKRYEDPKEREKTGEASRLAWASLAQEEGILKQTGKYPRTSEMNRNNSWAQIERGLVPEERERRSRLQTKLMEDPERREAISKAALKRYEDPEFLAKILGEGNPNWRGGISGGSYGYGWRAVAECILIRDDYICQLCGSKLSLVVHHINYDKEDVRDCNLVTLCNPCNGRVNGDREYWTKYFGAKMEIEVS